MTTTTVCATGTIRAREVCRSDVSHYIRSVPAVAQVSSALTCRLPVCPDCLAEIQDVRPGVDVFPLGTELPPLRWAGHDVTPLIAALSSEVTA